MEKTESNKAEVKSKPEKVKPEKESGNGEDDGLSQLRDEESLGTTDADIENLHDEAVREALAKDQVEGKRFICDTFNENSLLIFFGGLILTK